LATVAQAASLAERDIGILIEFESGKQRQGVLTPAEALELARKAVASTQIEFLGLMTYPSSPAVAPWVAAARALFDSAGVPMEVVSAGGTPGMWHAHTVAGLSEYRAGTYVYHDRKSVANGSGTLDACALHVHVTLVSRSAPDRGVIDAGSKVLTSDTIPAEFGAGYGHILEYPDAVVRELSEEHGVVDFSACRDRPAIGDRLRVVPNHVCPVSNLVDEVVAHRGGTVEAFLPVAARGKR
jgi:D-serine deaminase-like pyridoxal phosphate-dependent protein